MHKKPAKHNITLGKGGAKRQVVAKDIQTTEKGKKRSDDVMLKWFKTENGKTVDALLKISQQMEGIMATLLEVQANAVALAAAQVAEQARQDAKNVTLQSQIDAQVTALAAIQSELEALKGAGQTPENQVILDDINSKVTAVTAALNAAAV